MTHAPLIGSGVNRRLPEVTLRLIGAPTRPSAVTLQARLLGPWPGGPTPKTGRLRLTLKRHEKPGLGLVLAETTLRAGHARLRIDLTRAQLEAALFRSHGWRVVK